jgi:WhiB family transcriptional regulator, redox-sensing transcriptional regulator
VSEDLVRRGELSPLRISTRAWNETDVGTNPGIPNTPAGNYGPLEKPSDPRRLDTANCRGIDPNIFFVPRGGSTRRAREICDKCSVRENCLDHAIATGEKLGVMGGLTFRERDAIRKQREAEKRAALEVAHTLSTGKVIEITGNLIVDE